MRADVFFFRQQASYLSVEQSDSFYISFNGFYYSLLFGLFWFFQMLCIFWETFLIRPLYPAGPAHFVAMSRIRDNVFSPGTTRLCLLISCFFFTIFFNVHFKGRGGFDWEIWQPDIDSQVIFWGKTNKKKKDIFTSRF